MSSYPTPDFGARAATYDELQPAGENWWEVCEALVREGDLAGRRVLDVGCGTGKFAAALSERAKVWGADMQAKGLPATQVLQGYMAALRKSGAKVPRDWAN